MTRPSPGDQALEQQAALAELSKRAGSLQEVDDILAMACETVAGSLATDFVKVLEWAPQDKKLWVRAGYGWDDDVIGRSWVGADIESPAGYALRTSKPVIANELARETRFYVPELLSRHGVQSAVNCIIASREHIFGVLEADSRSSRTFSEQDIRFLEGAANLLAMTIERDQLSRRNEQLARQNEVLLREIRHRSANNMQLIQSLIALQRREEASPELVAGLDNLASRVHALSAVDHQLGASAESDPIDLGQYLMSVLGSLMSFHQTESRPLHLKTDMATAWVATDTAVPLGLIVNEFLTNSVKHAIGEDGGEICVTLKAEDDRLVLVLEDSGPGLPASSSTYGPEGTGLLLISLLAQQISAETDWTGSGATRLTVRFPSGSR